MIKGYAVKFSSKEGLLVVEDRQADEARTSNRRVYWIRNGSEKFLGNRLEVLWNGNIDQSFPAMATSNEIQVDNHQSAHEKEAIILSLKFKKRAAPRHHTK